MLSFLKKIGFNKSAKIQEPNSFTDLVQVDMHSHLLPGIDDGSQTIEESLTLIKQFVELGYHKLITTPHIMGDFYRNTPEIIAEKLNQLKNALKSTQISIEIEAAAEYYLDESLVQKLEQEEKLLTFGDNYLLFETSFYSKPKVFFEVVFNMQAQGYKPILAHPERYPYFYTDFEELEKIYKRGVLLQINLNSLTGYYSKPAQEFAETLIEKKMVSFVGSDCHNQKHLDTLKSTRNKKIYAKLSQLNLLNNSL